MVVLLARSLVTSGLKITADLLLTFERITDLLPGVTGEEVTTEQRASAHTAATEDSFIMRDYGCG